MHWGVFRPSRVAAVAIVLLSFSFLLMTLRLTQPVRSFRLFIFYLISPSQKTAANFIQAAGTYSNRLSELVRIHHQNAILEKKIQQLVLLETEHLSVLSENQRLRQLLNLKLNLPMETIPAIVSGRDAQNWFESLWIDRGIKDGILLDSPVLAMNNNSDELTASIAGVAGRILECGPVASKVLLISDPLSSIAAMIPRTQTQGLAIGQGFSLVIVDYLDPGSDIQPGDEVVTSGLGGIFPSGLLIGQIENISTTRSGFKRAKLKTAVSLGKIREVLVLKQSGVRE